MNQPFSVSSTLQVPLRPRCLTNSAVCEAQGVRHERACVCKVQGASAKVVVECPSPPPTHTHTHTHRHTCTHVHACTRARQPHAPTTRAGRTQAQPRMLACECEPLGRVHVHVVAVGNELVVHDLGRHAAGGVPAVRVLGVRVL
jgi:hypothetical protein